MPRNCAKDILNEIEYMLPQELQKHKQIRQKFTNEEDLLIIKLVGDNQYPNWNEIAKNIPSKSGRQCRERFQNYLSPNLSKEPWTKEEDELIISLYKEFGSSWSLIADYFGGKRTNNNIKNRWNTHLKSRFNEFSQKNNLTKNSNSDKEEACQSRNFLSGNISNLQSKSSNSDHSLNNALDTSEQVPNLAISKSAKKVYPNINQQRMFFSELHQKRNQFFHQQLVFMNHQPLIRRELQHRVIRLRQQQQLQKQQIENDKQIDELFNTNSLNEDSFNALDNIFNEATDFDFFQNISF
ncbi:hypothetical protein M9Y10_008962 [Tritrichomonas musculus]|uniref:Myb-like DNA-binding domain containing protein n=1 Tax=Tritrichomonas musculus TaxID=1915356 RepID=A0ABR2J0L5_9EUKA